MIVVEFKRLQASLRLKHKLLRDNLPGLLTAEVICVRTLVVPGSGFYVLLKF